ncbi:putative uncharacterized protein [Clostridium sp. CAG:575]|nr:putative uncharacterized protein [Clostridium sp. CAG:575]
MNNKIISKVVSGTLLFSMVGYTLPVLGYTKDETVYSKLDASGKNYETIVSTHIKNTEDEEIIRDLSDLLNVKNTSGDETYTQNGTTFEWKANKNDIYYQGNTDKELPISCEVKYELDGEEISANDIAGKSGKIKITLQYKNKEERTVNINGKNIKMYVPFVVMTGTIIQNENAKNVEVSSGKVVDDGTKTIVVGMAMPGLQESLGLSDDDIKIPSNIEITMDATNFKTNSIMSYITPKVLEEDDLKILDDLDEVYSQVNTLQTSMNQIQNGANTLKDGTTEIEAGANILKEGVTTAYNGAQTISSEVAKSTKSLKNDKSEAIDEATLKAIKQQAAQSSKLTEEQKAQITAQAKASSVLTEEQKAQITVQAKASSVLTDEKKAKIIAAAQESYPIELTEAEKALIIGTAKNVAEQTAVTTALKTAQDTATQTAVTTALTTAQNIATQTAVTTALTTAQETATSTAMQTSTTVAKQVGNQAKKQFTNQVISQMTTLGNGLNQLTSGLSQLNDGASSLADGTTQVNDGANTLAEGIKTFNEEGIKKICNYINGNVKDLTTRIDKLTELSKEYNTFTMVDGEDKGEVKFIMIIDAVKKIEENDNAKQEAVLNEEDK